MLLEERLNSLNNKEKTDIEEKQNSFLETTIGKIANTSIDIGLRVVLPDFLEDEVIEIKNTFLNNGFKQGIKKAVNSAIEIGKNISNIFTGDFKSVSQIKDTIKKGGLIDEISETIKNVIEKVKGKEGIDKNTIKKIEKKADKIMDTISSNIEENFSEQLEKENKIEKYIENWKKYYKEENFKGMEKELKKIKKEAEEFIPFEKTLENIEKIENINNLIKSKDGEFNLSENEKELIRKLN